MGLPENTLIYPQVQMPKPPGDPFTFPRLELTFQDIKGITKNVNYNPPT